MRDEIVAVDLSWFTGLETALTSLGTAMAGAIGAWFALRKRVSADTTSIAEDRVARSMLETMQKEREAAIKEAREAWLAMMQERDRAVEEARTAWEARTEDAKKIVMLEQQLVALSENYRRQSEELLAFRLRTQKLVAIVAKLDPTASHLLSLETEEPKAPSPPSSPLTNSEFQALSP
jgi:hypothetical protein